MSNFRLGSGDKYSKYHELENDTKLDPVHRLVIRSVNRCLNGDPGENIPGLRQIVVGRELERISTTACLGIYTVSDVNPEFEHRVLKQDNGEIKDEVVTTPSILIAGNVLVVGPPGGAKTLLARSFASLLGLCLGKTFKIL